MSLGGSCRPGEPGHRSEPLKQGAQKSACGMAAAIREAAAKGKGRDRFGRRRRDFKALGAKSRAA